MSVELKVLGSKCNLNCDYCYEKELRRCEVLKGYNLDAMLAQAEKIGCHFTVFGGEPLLVPFKDLERIFAFGFEKFKQNGIQSNGIMITEAYMYLFKKYNVHVGFSLDGPGKLNAARTDLKHTERAIKNLHYCLGNGLQVSLIVTMTKHNICPEFIIWLSELEDAGVRNVNMHFMLNANATHLIPDQEKFKTFLGWLYDAAKCFKTLKIDTIEEMKTRLFTGAGGCCVWNKCDPYYTSSVQGIGPFGEMHGCGRLYEEGVDYLKADTNSTMRDDLLLSTPQTSGGCRDCRYWHACHGFCPGTGLDGDWRNRSEHCESLKTIFGWIENDVWQTEVKE